MDTLDAANTGCVATNEDQHLSRLHPHWKEDESSTAGFFAVQSLEAAAHYVIGLRSLIVDGILVIAPTALVRSVVENVSHAAWILDPDITAETRVARSLLAQFEGSWHYKETLNKRSDKATKSAKRLREEIRGQIKSRFSHVHLPESGSDVKLEDSRVGDAEYAPWAKKCRRLTELISENGTAPYGLYDALSTLVHPNPIVMSTLVQAQENPSKPEFLDINYQWERETQIASELLYAGGSTVCNFFGLDSVHLDNWANHYKTGAEFHE